MIIVNSSLKQNQIFLTGFMATGKTAVGRILAARLERTFMDTDQLVEEKAGLSISVIFEKYGENHFRDLESEVLESLAGCTPGSLVVATGGGTVLRENNRDLLKQIGLVVLLHASAQEIYRRSSKTGDRPLLKGPDPSGRIKNLLQEREACYRDCDFAIDTTAKTPLQVAAEITAFLNAL